MPWQGAPLLLWKRSELWLLSLSDDTLAWWKIAAGPLSMLPPKQTTFSLFLVFSRRLGWFGPALRQWLQTNDTFSTWSMHPSTAAEMLWNGPFHPVPRLAFLLSLKSEHGNKTRTAPSLCNKKIKRWTHLGKKQTWHYWKSDSPLVAAFLNCRCLGWQVTYGNV